MAELSSTTGRRRRLGTRLALASVFTATVLAGPAAGSSAADDGSHDLSPIRPLAELELSLTPNAVVSADESAYKVTLTCTPDGGTHPDPKAACDSLRAVGGNFKRLPSTTDFCPLVYDPHTARATGSWQSSPMGPTLLVDYEETFSNRCFAAVGTDNVFNF